MARKAVTQEEANSSAPIPTSFVTKASYNAVTRKLSSMPPSKFLHGFCAKRNLGSSIKPSILDSFQFVLDSFSPRLPFLPSNTLKSQPKYRHAIIESWANHFPHWVLDCSPLEGRICDNKVSTMPPERFCDWLVTDAPKRMPPDQTQHSEGGMASLQTPISRSSPTWQSERPERSRMLPF